MKTFIYLALIIVPSLYAGNRWAQPGANLISGKVISFEESLSIQGATVTIKGSNKFAVTGADGAFKINVSPEDKILVITHPEYEPTEVNITGKTTYKVVLKLAN